MKKLQLERMLGSDPFYKRLLLLMVLLLYGLGMVVATHHSMSCGRLTDFSMMRETGGHGKDQAAR